jgi:hypothetical protein
MIRVRISEQEISLVSLPPVQWVKVKISRNRPEHAVGDPDVKVL